MANMIPSSAIHRRLSRWLLYYFSLFAPFKLDSMLIGSEEQKQKLKRTITWGRQLVLALYIYTSLRILVNIYFQYQHDSTLLELNYFLNRKITIDRSALYKTIGHTNRSLLSASGITLMDRLHESRRILKRLGAPHVNCTMTIEGIYILVVVITLSAYLYGYLAADRIPDTHFASMLADGGADSVALERMISEEAKSVVTSNRSSVLSMMGRVLKCEQIIERAQARLRACSRRSLPNIYVQSTTHPTWPSLSGRHAHLQQQVGQHELFIRQVNHLVESGKLVPVNRSPDWVDQMSLRFAAFALNNFIFSLAQDIFVTFYLADLLGFGLDMSSWTDYWFLGELWLTLIISISATTYYVGISSIHTVDQTRYVKKLQANYRERIQANLSQLEEIIRRPMMDKHDKKRRLDTIDLGLVKSILQYKIFLAQFESVRKSFSAAVSITCVLLVLIPVVLRAHSPYHLGSLMWTVSVGASLVMFAIMDGVLVPYCLIHHEGEKLYRLMCRLLAHTIEVNETYACEMDASSRGAVYNEHNIDLLRRILADPGRFTDRFAAHAFSALHLTFGKLVKIHYWYSLIMLSNFFQLDSWRRVFGSRLDDPLGLIRYSASAVSSTPVENL
jgi:hypothetical protein